MKLAILSKVSILALLLGGTHYSKATFFNQKELDALSHRINLPSVISKIKELNTAYEGLEKEKAEHRAARLTLETMRTTHVATQSLLANTQGFLTTERTEHDALKALHSALKGAHDTAQASLIAEQATHKDTKTALTDEQAAHNLLKAIHGHLQAQHTTLTDELNRAKKEVNDLKLQTTALEGERAIFEQQVKALTNEKTDLTTQVGTLTQEVKDKGNELATLTKQVAGKEAEITQVRTILSEKEQALTKSESDINQLKTEIATLKNSTVDKKELDQVQAKLDEATENNRKLADEVEALKQTLDIKDQEVATTKESLEKLQAEHAELQTKATDLEKSLQESERKLTEATTNLQQKETAISDLNTQIKDLTAQLDMQKTELTALTATNNKKEDELNNLRTANSELQTVQGKTEKTLKVKGDEIAKLNERIEQLNRDITTLKQPKPAKATAGLQANGAQQTLAIKKLEEEKKSLTSKVTTLEEELKKGKAANSAKLEQIKSLETKINSVNILLQTTLESLSTAQARLVALDQEIATTNDALMKARQENEVLQKSMEVFTQTSAEKETHLTKQIKDLEVTMGQSDASLQALQGQIKDLDAEKRALLETKNLLGQEKEHLSDTIKELEAKLKISTQAAHQKDDEMDVLVQKNDELIKELELLKKDYDNLAKSYDDLNEDFNALSEKVAIKAINEKPTNDDRTGDLVKLATQYLPMTPDGKIDLTQNQGNIIFDLLSQLEEANRKVYKLSEENELLKAKVPDSALGWIQDTFKPLTKAPSTTSVNSVLHHPSLVTTPNRSIARRSPEAFNTSQSAKHASSTLSEKSNSEEESDHNSGQSFDKVSEETGSGFLINNKK